MRKVTVKIEGISPYSQSRMHDEPKLDKETSNDYENRTWRERCNADKDGMVVIPAMAFKQALPIACKKIGRQIPGRGKSTYTKYFEGDVLCVADAKLGLHKDDMRKVTINAHANGQRGSGTRVKRHFPVVDEWQTEVEFLIFDDTITKDVFEETLTAAGMGVGVGRFRPENGGVNGRFRPVEFIWE